MALDPRLLRSPKEPTLFAFAVLWSCFVWLALFVSVLGLLYAAVFGLVIFMAHAIVIGRIKGNSVRLSARQLPALYARVEAIAAKLGLERVPEVYLVQSDGVLNAFATRHLWRDFLILNSSLVDACQDPRQLDFVIGHEMGHLAAGHLRDRIRLAPAAAAPWLGPALSRAREYTCDRYGLAASGDLEQAARGIAVLAAGGPHGSLLDLAAFEEQRLETGSFWMSIAELGSTHPFLCKRVAALREYSRPGSVEAVARHPLAYPLSPLLGGFTGGGGAVARVVLLGLFVVFAMRSARSVHPSAQADAGQDWVPGIGRLR
jgi:Zn-dependent protease with chaperone function